MNHLQAWRTITQQHSWASSFSKKPGFYSLSHWFGPQRFKVKQAYGKAVPKEREKELELPLCQRGLTKAASICWMNLEPKQYLKWMLTAGRGEKPGPRKCRTEKFLQKWAAEEKEKSKSSFHWRGRLLLLVMANHGSATIKRSQTTGTESSNQTAQFLYF